MRGRGVGRAARPGLIGTAARTAVIAGTATKVSGNVAAKQQAAAQQQAMAAQQAAVPPPPAPVDAVPAAAPAGAGLTEDMIAQLKQLAELRDAGILTEEEFSAKKSSILGI
jgi:hypothetical protein